MSVYLCKVFVALDDTPAMACHVIAASPKEAKSIAEAHFFKPVPAEVKNEAPKLAAHIEQAQNDARDAWYKVDATKSAVDPSNAINAPQKGN
jgi:hypothetical protein